MLKNGMTGKRREKVVREEWRCSILAEEKRGFNCLADDIGLRSYCVMTNDIH